MKKLFVALSAFTLLSASPLWAQQTVAISGMKTPNTSAPTANRNLPVMPTIACGSAQSYTAGRVVFPCVNLFGWTGVVLTDPSTGATLTPAVDATAGSAAIGTGPQIMGDCDDTSTVAGVENAAARLRVDCTSRALYTRPDGSTLKRYISVGSTEDESQVKATAGVLLGISARNAHASTDAYLKCTNLTAANTTPGSSTVFYEMIVPHASGYVDRNINATFDTALTCYIVTGKTDADATEVGANDVSYNLTYK